MRYIIFLKLIYLLTFQYLFKRKFRNYMLNIRQHNGIKHKETNDFQRAN